MAKFQVPSVGGIRKVIKLNQQVGTTIAEFGAGTITLAQLKSSLGIVNGSGGATNTGGGNIGTGSNGAIALGPGLSGGGPIVGAVPIYLNAPPALLSFEGEPGEDGLPGVIGRDGKAGANGAPGATGFGLDGDQGEDGLPGLAGPPGGTGATGASGGQQFGAYWISLSGGSVTLPINAVERVMNAAGAIKEINVVTKGGPGNFVINIYKAAFGSYPPTPSNDITGGHPPTLVGGITYQDSTLSGYTTTFSQDDVFLFTLASVANFTSVGIFLRI